MQLTKISYFFSNDGKKANCFSKQHINLKEMYYLFISVVQNCSIRSEENLYSHIFIFSYRRNLGMSSMFLIQKELIFV